MHACMYACTYVCVCGCSHVCRCVHIGSMSSLLSAVFTEAGSLVSSELAVACPQNLFLLEIWDCRWLLHLPSLHLGSRDTDSDLQACLASAFSTEPSAKFPTSYLTVMWVTDLVPIISVFVVLRITLGLTHALALSYTFSPAGVLSTAQAL